MSDIDYDKKYYDEIYQYYGPSMFIPFISNTGTADHLYYNTGSTATFISSKLSLSPLPQPEPIKEKVKLPQQNLKRTVTLD